MVITGPITGGEHGWAFGGPLLDFAALGYSSEEYFLDGTASRYAPNGRHRRSTDEGKWDVEPCESAPFKTRFVVYRPATGEVQRHGDRLLEQRQRGPRPVRRRQPSSSSKAATRSWASRRSESVCMASLR